MKVYENYSSTIGNTPLVWLKSFGVYGKVENRNPSGSVKCRIGANIILDAESKGLLPVGGGGHIVEASSGNTGIALAFVSASRGHKLTLVMPESMSIERRKLLIAFGAQLILSPASEGMKGAISRAEEIAKERGYFYADQFKNPANPAVHYYTTGPEIWNDTEGNVDFVVSGVGTGGTLTGVGRFLAERGSKAKLIAVEPYSSQVISQTIQGVELSPSPHKIQGIGTGFVPKNLDISFVSKTIGITDEEAVSTARELMQKEGVLAGISSGAALAAAKQVISQNPNSKVVVILPSSAERYLSTILFEGLNV